MARLVATHAMITEEYKIGRAWLFKKNNTHTHTPPKPTKKNPQKTNKKLAEEESVMKEKYTATELV